MKRILYLALICGLASAVSCFADEVPLHAALCYWYESNIGPVPEDTQALWELVDYRDGRDIQVVWKTKDAAAPDLKTVRVLAQSAQVRIWWENRRRELQARRMLNQDVMKAMLTLVNLRLPQDQRITQAELEAAYKAQLAAE